jgi:hypothetical protein
MGISSYYFKNVEGSLVKHDYWDFYLTSDNQGCKVDYATKCNDSCNYGVIEDGLVLWFDINNTGTTIDGSSLTSLTEWSGTTIKPSSGITLCDFGLTGVDNGRYNKLSGITVNLTSADTKVILYPVTGYTVNSITGTGTSGLYTYRGSFNTGTTTCDNCVVGSTVCLNGGFYQGYFKLDFLEPSPIPTQVTGSCSTDITTQLNPGDSEGLIYDLMPTNFSNGWSMETWVNPDNTICSGLTGTNLNYTYTANTGFFFYIGTRAENKFRNVFSGESGLYTCDGLIPLQDDIDVDVTNGFENWFLKSNVNFTSGCRCNTACTTTTSTTTATTYCDQLSENALGFRITPDGRIGYRKMTVSTGCYNNQDRITGTTMEEGYSQYPVIFEGNNWSHIVVTYSENSVKYGLPAGTLKFWVNGRVVYRVENFIGLQLRALDEWSNKQLGVPFNISWGGGTQGLLESQTFGGPDIEDRNLDLENNFAGTFDGKISQLRFYEKTLNLLEIRNNLYIDCDRYCVKASYGGAQIVHPDTILCGPDIIYTPDPGIVIELKAILTPGSINITYIATSSEILNSDITINFTSRFGVVYGEPIIINGSITIHEGTRVGNLFISLDDDWDRLTDEYEIISIEYISDEYLTISREDVVIYTQPVHPKPEGDMYKVYYGKLSKTTINESDVDDLDFDVVEQIVSSHLVLPDVSGYGYILIPETMNQPSLFRNSNEGCVGFVIPMIHQGDITIINDINSTNDNLEIIYKVYRTYVSTHAEVDVWLCN